MEWYGQICSCAKLTSSLHVESGMAKSTRSISWHVQVLNHKIMTFDEEGFKKLWGEESLKRAHGFNGFTDVITP